MAGRPLARRRPLRRAQCGDHRAQPLIVAARRRRLGAPARRCRRDRREVPGSRGKHLFNPGNLGVIFALVFLPGTWVSTGQWGTDLSLAGWFVALGGLVVHRACRADVTLAFLIFHATALALRVSWLGQSPAVWIHQLQSGALLLFAFFMISDPKTIPDHVRGRVAHAALVSTLAYFWQFTLYRPNSLLWALFLAAPVVPLWDALWPAAKYRWSIQGGNDEAMEVAAPGPHGRPARSLDLARHSA
jgi:Na+-translocating ferredoxin:NAD+ oxidoreductase RnfD subunit